MIRDDGGRHILDARRRPARLLVLVDEQGADAFDELAVGIQPIAQTVFDRECLFERAIGLGAADGFERQGQGLGGAGREVGAALRR